MKRNRENIIIDILEAAKAGANKTSIVYGTNLNFKLAGKYLDMLQQKGLVENKSGRYISTDRGVTFLKDAKEIVQQLEC